MGSGLLAFGNACCSVSVQLPLGAIVEWPPIDRTDDRVQKLRSSAPPVKIAESAVHQEPIEMDIHVCGRSNARTSSSSLPFWFCWLARVFFSGAHRLQVARRRWVLLPFFPPLLLFSWVLVHLALQMVDHLLTPHIIISRPRRQGRVRLVFLPIS